MHNPISHTYNQHKYEQNLSQTSVTNLFHIVPIKIITSLAAINASTLGINTILAKPEPACGFGAVGGSNSEGEAEPPGSLSGAQKP